VSDPSLWLADPRARDPDTGLWWAGVAPDGSGYPYEEATAWALLAGVRDERAEAELGRRIRAFRGLRRAGRRYLFDSGVALAAMRRIGDAALVDVLLQTVRELIAAGLAVDDGPPSGTEVETTRWSDAFGVHLLWLCGPLTELGEDAASTALIERILPGCVRSGGRLAEHPATDRVYAHAMAYAAEGLLTKDPADPAGIAATDALLGAALGPDGLVPARLTRGPLRTDATAQTLLLARLAGRLDHPAVGLIAGALTRVADPSGALPYEPGSAHLNSWATAFALRAEKPPPQRK